ncbi:alpha/beta hydrolase [Pseudoalteromonas xiamenensis]|uniref:Alpha/beta hydrolase n=1 Tax=Pseudoalteromonas xiamenensis TaxID=882626 RepID=A0A975HMY4_9GAMM|nr:alpha/beta hydrolase [Pseudoalteromonas xiamenensis]QTH73467.1 alpha/beta hydrolase [Pseudoalteromonas xiamenensis]
MFIQRILSRFFLVASLYVLAVLVGVRFFLDELIFVTTPNVVTNESSSFNVKAGATEAIVRIYHAKNDDRCIVFFSGRNGGIPRYEKEIFEHLLAAGISVYAISFPGYDGAVGRSTFSSVTELGNHALVQINKIGACSIDKSVFVGRSLGGALAVELAVKNPPAGILVDSIAPSLAVAIRAKLKQNWFTLPAAYLPLDVFMAFNPNVETALSKLNSKIVILQGSQDQVASYDEVAGAVSSFPNVKIIEVKGANHSNAHIVGQNLYLKELDHLFENIVPPMPEI